MGDFTNVRTFAGLAMLNVIRSAILASTVMTEAEKCEALADLKRRVDELKAKS